MRSAEELEIALIRAYLTQTPIRWNVIQRIAFMSESDLVKDLFVDSLEASHGKLIRESLERHGIYSPKVDHFFHKISTTEGEKEFRWPSSISRREDVKFLNIDIDENGYYDGFRFSICGEFVDVSIPFNGDYLEWNYHRIIVTSQTEEEFQKTKKKLLGSGIFDLVPGKFEFESPHL